VEDAAINSNYRTPYKFTGKELDPETGMYYFGARDYDARISRWISADRAFESYLPKGNNDFDSNHDYYYHTKHEKVTELPGHGGIFRPINIDLYRFCSNNPIRILTLMAMRISHLPGRWAGNG
jgi:RHS repeat-associated protein